MERITATFVDGKSVFDFHGYAGNDCSKEADAIRAFLARVGVKTDVKDEDRKNERIAIPNGPLAKRIAE